MVIPTKPVIFAACCEERGCGAAKVVAVEEMVPIEFVAGAGGPGRSAEKFDEVFVGWDAGAIWKSSKSSSSSAAALLVAKASKSSSGFLAEALPLDELTGAGSSPKRRSMAGAGCDFFGRGAVVLALMDAAVLD